MIMITKRYWVAALLFLLSPALVWSQTSAQVKQSDPVADDQTQTKTQNTDLVSAPIPAGQNADTPEPKQSKRIFGLVPNYSAVSADTFAPPLDTRGKFALAMHDSMDRSAFVQVGLLSAVSMAMNRYPEFHHGVAGYSRYYWHGFADQVSGAFFTEAIVPALTHEDPRYYTLGHGGFFHRTNYALSRVVVTQTDSGGRCFNFSEVLGTGMTAGLANLYYPAPERGMNKTMVNWGTQAIVAGASNVLKEFWPDIRHRIFRQK